MFSGTCFIKIFVSNYHFQGGTEAKLPVLVMANYICLLTRGAEDVRRRFTSVHSEAPMIIQHQSENLSTQCFFLAKLWSVVAKIFYDDRSTENAITGSTLGAIGHIEKGAEGTLFLHLRLSLRVGRLDHHCFFLPLAHCSVFI